MKLLCNMRGITSYILLFVIDLLLSDGEHKRAQAAHIVGISSIGVSPTRTMAKIGQALAVRGHSFTIIVPSHLQFLKFSKEISVKVYKNPYAYDVLMQTFQVQLEKGMFTEITALSLFSQVAKRFCEVLLNTEELFSSLGQVDIILGDVWCNCAPIVADKLGVPRVDLSTPGFFDPWLSIFHNIPVSVNHRVPKEKISSPLMSMIYRTQNCIEFGFVYILHHIFQAKYEKLWMMHVKNSKYRSLKEVIQSSNIVLVQSDFAMEFPRPYGPHIKVVGPIIPEPSKPLPNELEHFINEGEVTKLVVVSFGTVLTPKQYFIDTIANALAALPVKVVWKLSRAVPMSLGNNTKILPWIPQNDLLGHARTRVFVTHAGMHSTLEGAYHGVPMVAIPLFADQERNAAKISESNIGLVLDKFSITPKLVQEAIITAMEDETIQENVKRVSLIMRSHRPLPVEMAANWVEYGLDTRGAPHLRNEAENLLFYQTYFLDVLLMVLMMVTVVILGIVYAVKCVCKICQRSKKHKID